MQRQRDTKTDREIVSEFFTFVTESIINSPGENKALNVLSLISAILYAEEEVEHLEMVLRLHFPEHFAGHKPFTVL